MTPPFKDTTVKIGAPQANFRSSKYCLLADLAPRIPSKKKSHRKQVNERHFINSLSDDQDLIW